MVGALGRMSCWSAFRYRPRAARPPPPGAVAHPPPWAPTKPRGSFCWRFRPGRRGRSKARQAGLTRSTGSSSPGHAGAASSRRSGKRGRAARTPAPRSSSSAWTRLRRRRRWGRSPRSTVEHGLHGFRVFQPGWSEPADLQGIRPWGRPIRISPRPALELRSGPQEPARDDREQGDRRQQHQQDEQAPPVPAHSPAYQRTRRTGGELKSASSGPNRPPR